MHINPVKVSGEGPYLTWPGISAGSVRAFLSTYHTPEWGEGHGVPTWTAMDSGHVKGAWQENKTGWPKDMHCA